MRTRQIFLSIALFLGVYIVPMLIATALGIHGLPLLFVAIGAFVVQVALTVRFYIKGQPAAGFVGIIVIMIQVVLYVLSNFMVIGAITSVTR